MPRRNIHELPEKLGVVVEGIIIASRPVEYLPLIKRYGRSMIKKLISDGYLWENQKNGRHVIEATPLSKSEFFDRELMRNWVEGTPISRMTAKLGINVDRVFREAEKQGIIRGAGKRSQIQNPIMPWQIRRLRISLVDAERRGLNLSDDGEGLQHHRALLRRFYRARELVLTINDSEYLAWTADERSQLLGITAEWRSIASMAKLMDRDPSEIARQLSIQGRSVGFDWSKAEDSLIVEGFLNNQRVSCIARHLPGRSWQDVKFRIKQICGSKISQRGWAPRELKNLLLGMEKGLSGKQLYKCVPTRSHHSSRRLIYQILHESRDHTRWNSTDYYILFQANLRGESPETIANWLGRSEHSVAEQLTFCLNRKPGAPPKLTEADALAIRAALEAGELTITTAATKYNVTCSTIHRALKDVR